ncbi:hypothetical protein BH09PSE4_BH09PSE4_04640 [soil metagenome]
MQLDRIEATPICAEALQPYESTLNAVGASGFYRTFSRALRDGMHVDRLYLFEGAERNTPLIAEVEAGKPQVTGSTYARRFLPDDPLQAAIDLARTENAVVRLSVTPADIIVPSYRLMLERAGIAQRISFVRSRRKAWRCLTVARRGASGTFSPEELAWLGGFYRLVTPLIDRHRELTGEVVQDRGQRIVELEERFAQRHPELTEREREVCARAAIGMSVEGAALDLGVAISSVLTYRKRAYRRLGVSAANELARLVMR